MMRRLARISAALAASATAVVAPAGFANGATSEGFVGTCIEAAELPCSASAGQTYDGMVIGADGNDKEPAVEAVLSDVVGPAADVTALAHGLTRSSGDVQFTPDDVTRAQSFDWSYTGDAANLAYLTVKAANGFAVFGVAGTREGSIDVAGLLGGHDISHVSVWVTNVSQTDPIKPTRLHGKDFLGNMRLSKIDDWTVPCLHVETAEPATCEFTRRSGQWLESKKGRFAVAGQAITLDGKSGGDYVTASKIGPEGAVPALEPTGNDSAGTVSDGQELTYGAVVETALSPNNATGQPLVNYATLEVCTSSYPHPDGTPLAGYYWNGSNYVFCYIGEGAGLNDKNGTERDYYGVYYTEPERCHVIWRDGYEAPAAKRPATNPYPYPGTVDVNSPLVWRPVSSLTIANE